MSTCISSVHLLQVIEYLYYQHKYSDTLLSKDAIPEFVIPEDIELDLLVAANYLGMNQ